MGEDASWHCLTMRGMECAHPATARARARVRTIGSQASATPRAPPSSLKIALRPVQCESVPRMKWRCTHRHAGAALAARDKTGFGFLRAEQLLKRWRVDLRFRPTLAGQSLNE